PPGPGGERAGRRLHPPRRAAAHRASAGAPGHHHRDAVRLHARLGRVHLRPDLHLHDHPQDRHRRGGRRPDPRRRLLLGLLDGRGPRRVAAGGDPVLAVPRPLCVRADRGRGQRPGGVRGRDQAPAKIGEAFAAQHDAAFAGEFIDQPEVAAKLTAEEQAQAGHDIVDLQDNLPTIHKNFLVPLDDVVAEIEKEFGAFYPVAKDSGYVEGHWLSLPWLGNSELAVYRSDYFAQAGEPIPSTWNDVLRAAPKLKQIGHPVGIAISQTEDSNAALYPLLWAFGAGV